MRHLPDGCDADPIKMHVYGKRGGWRVIRQAALLAAHFSKRHPRAAEFRRQRQQQILRRPELPEIFVKEAVFPVVGGGARSKTREHLFVEHRHIRPQQGHTRVLHRMRVTVADRALFGNSCVMSWVHVFFPAEV